MNPIARTMKRYINTPLKYALPLLFVGALVLSATTGCITPQNTVQQAASTPAGQQSSGDPISVTVTPTGTSMQVGSYNTPKTGYKYVSYSVTVKNNNANNQIVSPGFVSLRTSDGKAYDVDSAMYDKSVDGLQNVMSTQPGDTVSGTVIYQIPQSATPTSILYNDYSHKVTTNL